MSERRKDEPTMQTIPDRLPGEAELSQLYQENADEQPSLVVDQLILNQAREVVQPPSHLRLISRRWTVPLTLAAGLLVSIGIVTMLHDNLTSPLVPVSTSSRALSRGQLLEQSKQVKRERRESLSAADPQRLESEADVAVSDSSSSITEPGRSREYVGFGAALEQQTARDTLKPKAASRSQSLPLEELLSRQGKTLTDSLLQKRPSQKFKSGRALGLVVPLPSDSTPVSDERDTMTKRTDLEPLRQPSVRRAADLLLHEESKERINETKEARQQAGQPAALLGEFVFGSIQDDGSANTWLLEIKNLFQAGYRSEAEKGLQAFRKHYPSFDDFPEHFPQELLDKVSAEAGGDERE